MKTIHLSALDLDLEVPDTINYYDAGFTKRIPVRETLSDKVFCTTIEGNANIKYSITKPWRADIKISYSDRGEFLSTFTRGHEETHALRNIDFLLESNTATTTFLTAVLKRTGVEINIPRLEKEIKPEKVREEVLANFGGFLALKNKNYSAMEVLDNYLNSRKGLLTLEYHFDWYIKSLLKNTRLKNLIK